MLTRLRTSQAFWFRGESGEIMYYNLMGTLLGMAIYNGTRARAHVCVVCIVEQAS
jgi:hypothetical protein